MKVYYSYWSQGYWNDVNDFTLDMFKLSTHFSKKHYNEVHLITDSNGIKHLKNIFDWTSISTELDIIPNGYESVWSLGKLLAYKIAAKKGKPFVHVDSDVILWGKLPGFIEKADVFSQSREGHITEWNSTHEMYNLPDKYYIKNAPKPFISPNCGIFGGNDLDFIYKYANTAYKLVTAKENEYFWKGHVGHHFEKPVLAEQYYLAICAEVLGKDIEYLLEYGTEEECEKYQYTHFLGAKSDPNLKYKLKEALRKLKLN